ncbi:MAG: thioredoxin fold domain-containing protein [Bacteroidia bacterium]|nr:thioredoxin fold domain-containing protein [Bacteroidia bacterium]NNJ55901.1 thioredoxin fold domain-containing protein [Bacteroidia bacterium]
MKNSLFILSLFVFIGCNSAPKNKSFEKLIKLKEHTVLMFIAPDCPMCKTLSQPYNELVIKYPEVQFLAVHSGKNYDAMEINMFATETKFTPPIFRDYEYEIAHQFKATITPEFILIDSSGKTLYQGLMDDRILQLGSYKQTWDKMYLEDAIQAVLADKPPKVKKTDPVGCVLEY